MSLMHVNDPDEMDGLIDLSNTRPAITKCMGSITEEVLQVPLLVELLI